MKRSRSLGERDLYRCCDEGSLTSEVFYYLAIFWKATFLQFREDELSIDTDLKASPVRGDDHAPGNVSFLLIENLFRQTDGFGRVASRTAILDFQFSGHSDTSFPFSNIAEGQSLAS